MDIAVIGAGIAGLGAARALSARHRVTIYEAAGYAGGHSHTVDVPVEDGRVAVDTGFIVYNERTYPHLTALFASLDVPTETSDMSFSVSMGGGAYEYAGRVAGLFAQPANLVRTTHWSLVADILRFRRRARRDAATLDPGVTLGRYLEEARYSEAFRHRYLLPMAAAIWSASVESIERYPATTFLRFFANHGLIELTNRPQWRTVSGGSREYVSRLLATFPGRIRLNTPVTGLRRRVDGITVTTPTDAATYDHVVLATHTDTSLRLLAGDATAAEAEVLGKIGYSDSRVVLHQDQRLMPRRRRVWSSWNYLAAPKHELERGVSVTYWMNRLQNLPRHHPLFVSLNPLEEPDPATVIGQYRYAHPQFDLAAVRAQRRLGDIQGRDRVWFCGAWCGYGFHEDGLVSGLRVAQALDATVPWEFAARPQPADLEPAA